MCNGKDLSSRRSGAWVGAWRMCIWLNSNQCNLGVDWRYRFSVGSSPEAVGFYASSQPQDSRKGDREPFHWRRRCP